MTLTIIIAIVAFLVITLALVGLLLFAKAKLTTSGDVTIDINGGEKVLIAESGGTLLSTLATTTCSCRRHAAAAVRAACANAR